MAGDDLLEQRGPAAGHPDDEDRTLGSLRGGRQAIGPRSRGRSDFSTWASASGSWSVGVSSFAARAAANASSYRAARSSSRPRSNPTPIRSGGGTSPRSSRRWSRSIASSDAPRRRSAVARRRSSLGESPSIPGERREDALEFVEVPVPFEALRPKAEQVPVEVRARRSVARIDARERVVDPAEGVERMDPGEADRRRRLEPWRSHDRSR